MTTTVKVSHLQLIEEARAAREAGIKQAEDADVDGWDKKTIAQAIRAFSGTGLPFSANDLRPLLPEVRSPLIGGCFLGALHQGVIRKVGAETSLKKNTHCKKIALWIDANQPGEEPA